MGRDWRPSVHKIPISEFRNIPSMGRELASGVIVGHTRGLSSFHVISCPYTNPCRRPSTLCVLWRSAASGLPIQRLGARESGVGTATIGGGDQSGARQKPSARPRARFVGRNVETKVKKTRFELSKMDQKASLRHVRKSGYIFSSKTLTILRTYGTCFRGFKSARLLSYEPGSMILIVTLRTPQ
jgi:hypothetical protein